MIITISPTPFIIISILDSHFNFIVHSLYSGGAPFVSASYLTTGAFQYIQASIAYMLHADFVKFAYLVVSPISALMFPFSLYLLITRFTDDTLDAAFGTFAALLIITWLGEGDTAPGFWIFTRSLSGQVYCCLNWPLPVCILFAQLF